MSYSLHVNNYKTDCIINDTELKFETEDDYGDVVKVEISDIIGLDTDDDAEKVSLYYIQRVQSPKWTQDAVQFTGTPGICKAFVSDIKNRLHTIEHRPRRLLVIVNPFGGAKNGRNVYNSIVSPLLTLANINTNVKFTEKPKHVTDIINNYDLDTIDGIVVCGGDGTYQECVDTLFKRLHNETGIDLNATDFKPKNIQIPIGIVPTGTGNAIAENCYGCKDHVTSVLHIIKGHRRCRMIGGVYCDNRYVTCTALLVAYGLFGKMSAAVEEQRWLSRARYLIVPTYYFLIKPQEEINLEITAYCRSTEDSPISNVESNATDNTTKEIKDVYTNLIIFMADMLDDDDKIRENVLTSYKTSDIVTLTLFKKCSRWSLVSFLFKLMAKNENTQTANHLTIIRYIYI
ncbi:hypothetical protein KUTeg_019880 [Tegillarca granosa]|uniref:DAGKc domain-containing protein n=1 Tax=Tegillarca granosa TaxID=220873 RepID=A0ABQ9EDR8_TEGGR|nr:hypothetical protein KUTeg_019880 [Tegillarca granosa]